ncbi:MAG: hypothetical protein EOO13_06025 [Chitinophagaceae bacterium]|nr:MAG: hypothetical protein EOO13_06025 [Chitinophagaceae bacterium]
MKRIVLVLLAFLASNCYAQNGYVLSKYSLGQLRDDFDLAVNSLKEAHPGLYWHTGYLEFDSICNVQRSKLSQASDALEFYRILAPVIVASREGHCKLSLSDEVDRFLDKAGLYPPLFVKFIGQVPYVINTIQGRPTVALELVSIDGRPISEVLSAMFALMPSDGHNRTKKYAALEGQDFSYYYLDAFSQRASYLIGLKDPATNITTEVDCGALPAAEMEKQWAVLRARFFGRNDVASSLVIEGGSAILTFNTFRSDKYPDFYKTVDGYFQKIGSLKVKNLIIDLRANGGGTEGYEDYVLSHLVSKAYRKYSYVQASALSFSFYRFTNLNTAEKQASFNATMAREHFVDGDGRVLRRTGILEPEPPRKKAFGGKVYVLISGQTYSGGSEFASLLKIHRKAIAVGEETGGGFYGNTSGFALTLTLPNSGLKLKVPLLKFVLQVPGLSNPLGHGLMPDYRPEESFSGFLKGIDPGLDLVKRLIARAE